MCCIVVRGDAWPVLLAPCNTTGWSNSKAHTHKRPMLMQAVASLPDVLHNPISMSSISATSRNAPWHCKTSIITQPLLTGDEQPTPAAHPMHPPARHRPQLPKLSINDRMAVHEPDRLLCRSPARFPRTRHIPEGLTIWHIISDLRAHDSVSPRCSPPIFLGSLSIDRHHR